MRSFVVGVMGVVVGSVLAWFAINSIGSRSRQELAAVPEIGGQPVPEQVIEIEFDRRYDVHTSIYGVEPMTFANCKIMGFTGRRGGVGKAQRESGAGMFSSSSGYSSSDADHFEHWLVLEQADGRLLYLPPNSVKYLEQAAGGKK